MPEPIHKPPEKTQADVSGLPANDEGQIRQSSVSFDEDGEAQSHINDVYARLEIKGLDEQVYYRPQVSQTSQPGGASQVKREEDKSDCNAGKPATCLMGLPAKLSRTLRLPANLSRTLRRHSARWLYCARRWQQSALSLSGRVLPRRKTKKWAVTICTHVQSALAVRPKTQRKQSSRRKRLWIHMITIKWRAH